MQWLQITLQLKLAEINVLYKASSNRQLYVLHSFLFRNLGKYRSAVYFFIQIGNLYEQGICRVF